MNERTFKVSPDVEASWETTATGLRAVLASGEATEAGSSQVMLYNVPGHSQKVQHFRKGTFLRVTRWLADSMGGGCGQAGGEAERGWGTQQGALRHR